MFTGIKPFRNTAWSVASAHQLPELSTVSFTCAGCLNELMAAIKVIVWTNWTNLSRVQLECVSDHHFYSLCPISRINEGGGDARERR